MKKETYTFKGSQTDIYFNTALTSLGEMVPREKAVLLVDENFWQHHHEKLEGWKIIPLPAGEEYKVSQTVFDTIEQLIELGADRDTILVGIGGGVTTDLAGFTASIFMRGIRFGFVPTTLLAMVDACIGGKNGVDIGLHKNMAGTFNQPSFICYDYELLQTLPQEEWINGFAEVIKHACIRDAAMFHELAENSLEIYQYEPALLASLIERNARIKLDIVTRDENEQGDRKLLNFGHTLGHAIETVNKIPHGHAISIGMMAAAALSEEINQFASAEKEQLSQLLQQYELPVQTKFDKEKIWNLVVHDKKRKQDSIQFILLNRIGDAKVQPIPLIQLEHLFTQTL